MRSWFLLACWLWLTSLPVAAAAEIEMQAQPALGRNARFGDPVPISVRLFNRGPACTLRIQARPIHNSGRPSEDLPQAEATTELAPGARKQLPLLVPPLRGSSEIEIIAWEGRRQVARNTLTLNITYSKSRITAVLTSETGAFAWLAAQTWDDSQQAESLTVNEVPAETFPEEAAGLAGGQFMVLHDLSRLPLSAAAQGAIADWVRSGGRLLVFATPDPAEFRGSPLEALLPIRPTGTDTAEGLPVLTGPLDQGLVVQSRGGLPLLTVAPRVAGVAGLIGTPLPSTDILGSVATRNLLHAFTSACDLLAGRFPDLPDDLDLLTAPPELEPPNLALVGWAMLAYVLVVGPVNWMFLRRTDRMLAVFLTVPALAGGFATLTFLGGWMVRGSDLLLLEAGQLALRSGQASARWQGATALYSPRTTEYTLSFPLNLSLTEDRGGDPSRWPGFSLVLDTRQEFRHLKMRMWSMRRFRGQRTLLLRGAITLEPEEGTMRVWNASELDLSDCVTFHQGRSSAPFDVPAGARVRQAWQGPHHLASFPKASNQDARYRAERELLLKQASKYQARHPSTSLLMGWSQTSASGVECSDPRARQTVLNFVVVQGEDVP